MVKDMALNRRLICGLFGLFGLEVRRKPQMLPSKQATSGGADFEAIEREQNEKFAGLGLDRNAGLERLNHVLPELIGRDFNGMTDSIHWLLFACLSGKIEPKRILEIGTGIGNGTAILSRMFPDAEITTVDMPTNDPLYWSAHQKEGYEEFLSNRQNNLGAPNIRLLEANSFFLLDHLEGKFDLVWVDGDHILPAVAWDICNAYHVCRPGGLILCDDVWLEAGEHEDDHISLGSFQTLSYIEDRIPETITYFSKRMAFANSESLRRRKSVTYLQKPV